MNVSFMRALRTSPVQPASQPASPRQPGAAQRSKNTIHYAPCSKGRKYPPLEYIKQAVPAPKENPPRTVTQNGQRNTTLVGPGGSPSARARSSCAGFVLDGLFRLGRSALAPIDLIILLLCITSRTGPAAAASRLLRCLENGARGRPGEGRRRRETG